MKISKLFHWLYAFLMFLPITFILPTLLYFGFNDNATAQEYTKEEPVFYETNEVEDIDDIYNDHIYRYNNHYVVTSAYNEGVVCDLDFDLMKLQFPNLNNLTNVTRCFIYYVQNSHLRLFTYYGNSENLVYNINEVTFNFIPISINRTLFEQVLLPYVSSTDYRYLKDYEEVTYTMGITDSVNQAIIDTFDLPMFSWATNNILVAPFSSICSFFGIASTSVLIKYLYYWLTISVIWLVFDVLMYIPLLVHNYIDKARIE